MKHIKTFESFLNENFELNESSLVSKPQWRLGDMGDARYSVGINYAGGKLSLLSKCNGLYLGKSFTNSETMQPDWGSSYTIYPATSRFSFEPNTDFIQDLLDGLNTFIEDIVKNANEAFLKSTVAKNTNFDLTTAAVNKVKSVTVNFSTGVGELWKKSEFKKLDDAQKIAFFEDVKKLITKTFRNTKGIELQNKYGGDALAFTVEF